jgi:hypothetical protein
MLCYAMIQSLLCIECHCHYHCQLVCVSLMKTIYVGMMTDMMAGGHSLSYMAVRALYHMSGSRPFIRDHCNQRLIGVIVALLRSRNHLLRYHSLLLLYRLTINAPIASIDRGHHKGNGDDSFSPLCQLIAGSSFGGIRLLCSLIAIPPPSASSSSSMDACNNVIEWQHERWLVLQVMCYLASSSSSYILSSSYRNVMRQMKVLRHLVTLMKYQQTVVAPNAQSTNNENEHKNGADWQQPHQSLKRYVRCNGWHRMWNVALLADYLATSLTISSSIDKVRS